ncbi:MAG TPA: hypothetical protein VLC09_19330 [Polyangiaceae bacterium]|nr:hypothetical protein [Polyangiaceae bacterium]
MRERPVARLRGAPSHEVWTAHYCEVCAARLDGGWTQRWAWFVAGLLLGVLAATAAPLYWGSRRFALQLVLSAVAGLALPIAGRLSKLWAPAQEPLYLAPGRRLWAERRAFAEALGSAIEEVEAPHRALDGARMAAPGLLAVAWCLGLHAWGSAELRVVEAEPDVALLVDHALQGRVSASLDEAPESGLRIAILSGLRHFTLVDDQGRIRADVESAVIPGRTYLLGTPPRGRCFYLERRSYGQAQLELPARERLPGEGPLWQLSEPIDFWFVPLPEPGPDWTSGGSMTALRLLPCTSTHTRQTAER